MPMENYEAALVRDSLRCYGVIPWHCVGEIKELCRVSSYLSADSSVVSSAAVAQRALSLSSRCSGWPEGALWSGGLAVVKCNLLLHKELRLGCDTRC
ncbi:hypothetical protein CesoFtcFv8_022429 [Champsocephalus esox]|uniref:Uncharacterized protein n=4 Tax=Channichthyidae TaxID=30806 RepID=A0AAN8CQ18_CHAGU|nr:hypothetical protein CesoFtcFv8_022429 [Champsocephalus esox]KAK5906360.1 hypothetical protein CgunFtcFv8_002234 [Champsocephalus gunnari]